MLLHYYASLLLLTKESLTDMIIAKQWTYLEVRAEDDIDNIQRKTNMQIGKETSRRKNVTMWESLKRYLTSSRV